MESLEEIQMRCSHLYQRAKAAYGPRLQEAWCAIIQYSQEHPFISLFLVVALALCILPMLMFFWFAVATIGVTFLGFVFVEGRVSL